MLLNFAKVAYRNLRRRPVTTIINVIGLGVSLALGMVIFLLYWQKASYDEIHPGVDRLHQVTKEVPGVPFPEATTPAAFGPALDRRGDVEAYTRLSPTRRVVQQSSNTFGHDALLTDPSFFDVFGFPLVAGVPDEVLASPDAVVVTQRFARRVFGTTEDVVGQSVTMASGDVRTITGVVQREGIASHIQFDALYPLPAEMQTGWESSTDLHTFVRLQEGTSPAALQPRLDALAQEAVGQRAEERMRVGLVSMSDLASGELVAGALGGEKIPPFLMGFLALLAGLVIATAAFNYVNLSVARSQRRSEEIGVRKTMGANPEHVAGQFILESVFVALLALVIAGATLVWLIPQFNQLHLVRSLGEQVSLEVFKDPVLWGWILGLVVVIGVLSGAYPAFRLSRFQPVEVLRGHSSGSDGSAGGIRLRHGLIVAQIGLTVVFLITAVTLVRQSGYVLGKDPGYDASATWVVEDVDPDQARGAAAALLSHGGVRRVAGTGGLPMSGERLTRNLYNPAADTTRRHTYYSVDPAYFDILNLSVVAGTLDDFAASNGVVLNEASVPVLGFERPDVAVGKTVQIRDEPRPVLAVVKDFHFQDLKNEIGPLALGYEPSLFRHYVIERQPDDEGISRTEVDRLWQLQIPSSNPTVTSLQQIRAQRYSVYTDLSGVMGTVSLFSIIIALLGLMGITAHAVEARRKEIGIRKAVGATTQSVTLRLLRETAALLGVAFVLFVPLAWLLNTWWLQSFAYRIDFGLPIILLSVLVVAGSALGTASLQAYRAARRNVTLGLRDA